MSDEKKNDESKFHVMSVTADQQVCLRYCLQNLYGFYVSKCLTSERDMIDKAKYIMKYFKYYNDLTENYATQSTRTGSKTKCFYYNNISIHLIKKSLEIFNKTPVFLDTYEIEFVKSKYEKLKELVDNSSKFQYTKSEVAKARQEES